MARLRQAPRTGAPDGCNAMQCGGAYFNNPLFVKPIGIRPCPAPGTTIAKQIEHLLC